MAESQGPQDLQERDPHATEMLNRTVQYLPHGTELMRFGDVKIPDLVWIDAVGGFKEGDFFMDREIPDLIVSEKALQLLQEFDLKRARIEEFRGG